MSLSKFQPDLIPAVVVYIYNSRSCVGSDQSPIHNIWSLESFIQLDIGMSVL